MTEGIITAVDKNAIISRIIYLNGIISFMLYERKTSNKQKISGQIFLKKKGALMIDINGFKLLRLL